MSSTKVLPVIAVVLLAGVAIIITSQHRSQAALREQNALLRRRLAQLESENESLSNRLAHVRQIIAPRLPAPPMPATAVPERPDEAFATNVVAHMANGGEAPKLTAEQLKRYLEENHRSASSLLAAYRTTGDAALLQEALEKYPGDAQVAFEAAIERGASPEQRRASLDAFKKAASDNPLADYLSALDYFKTGQTDQAVKDLIDASGRQNFADYTVQRIQADEEAYRAAGYSEADAKMAATWGVGLPQLQDLRALGQDLVQLAASYRSAGDESSAQSALQLAIGLGGQLDATTPGCTPLLTRLVGINIQRGAFEAMNPSSSYGDGTVQSQIDQLGTRRQWLKDLVQQVNPFFGQMTSEDWMNYNERTLAFGEESAVAWLVNKYGGR